MTIGEALEAAESAATGLNTVLRGGMAAAAQSAATLNARVSRDEDKTKLRDVLHVASIDRPTTYACCSLVLQGRLADARGSTSTI
ncbi:unnamed protein product [Musa textilis]